MKIERVWAMPNAATYSVKPIASLISRYWKPGIVSVDPFARDTKLATYRNDLSPAAAAEFHLEADKFLQMLIDKNTVAEMVFFDPPYSRRQTLEVYQSIGIARLPQRISQSWRLERDLLALLCQPFGLAMSFGWNSQGLGKKRGFEIIEILLVNHGGDHNDTICTVERKTGDCAKQKTLFEK